MATRGKISGKQVANRWQTGATKKGVVALNVWYVLYVLCVCMFVCTVLYCMYSDGSNTRHRGVLDQFSITFATLAQIEQTKDQCALESRVESISMLCWWC